MFTEHDYAAAHLRDVVRYLNEAIERANKAGLTFTVRVESQPAGLVVADIADPALAVGETEPPGERSWPDQR